MSILVSVVNPLRTRDSSCTKAKHGADFSMSLLRMFDYPSIMEVENGPIAEETSLVGTLFSTEP